MSTLKSEAFFLSGSRPSGFRGESKGIGEYVDLFAFAILGKLAYFPGAVFLSNRARTPSSKQAVIMWGDRKNQQNQPGTFEKASRGGYSERVSSPDRGDHRAQSQTRDRP